ncbi:MAG: nucleotidyltransferase family protein [Bacteroidales bacterium]|jgi:D-glycero-alpha-D-manno-heptose 1-phosphate guanylyltransferase|nr:nucleotidyltransferase family protein [Bacteroidales bacterium]
MKVNEAIILAGGLGTRLREVTGTLPKVMAPVGGRPFLEYLLNYLAVNKIKKVILATGYESEVLKSHFGDSFKGLSIKWSDEEEPLGTGGAILQATAFAESDSVFILNGDTLFDVPLEAMADETGRNFSSISLALKPMIDFDRYGSVEIKNGIITSFQEKKFCREGLINGGVYLLSCNWLINRAPGIKFSFEKDILEKYVSQKEIAAFICDNYFIDIGIPADFRRAQTEIPQKLPL